MSELDRAKLYLGCAPASEWCAQVGTDGYLEQAKRECRAWINQLRRVFGPEPTGAKLAITSNPHDFGAYLDVVIWFYGKDRQATDYAYKVEDNRILLWDAEARKELKLLPEE